MTEASDHWFVRFPDGRVVRAANTTIVRQQVNAGKIPAGSSVRRSPDEEWTALAWTREFADLSGPSPSTRAEKPEEKDDADEVELAAESRLAPEAVESAGFSARLDRKRLKTVGVRGVMHELLAALDSTLVRKKLAAAALAGLCAGVVLACAQMPALEIETATPWGPWVRWAVAGAALVLIVTMTAGMLTRMTFFELSRMRQARFSEGFTGLAGTTFRIAAAQLLTAGVACGLIFLLRWFPGYLLESHLGGGVGDAAAAGAAALGLILELVLWPVVGFSLLLPPILVVEGCSVGKGLTHWLRLLRVDLGRVFLYEALALGLGLSATLLLALPWLVLFTYQPDARLLQAVTCTRLVLAGLALAPLLAYLMVANVFIYINLRYESSAAGRR